MSMWDHLNRTRPKNLSKTTKTPKFSQNLKPRSQKMHECMKDEEKESLERLTNKLMLGLGQKLDGQRDLREEMVFGLREKRKESRYLSEEQTRLTLKYIQKQVARQIEQVSRRCRELNLDRSRRCRVVIEQTKTIEQQLDGSGYLWRGIEKTQKFLID